MPLSLKNIIGAAAKIGSGPGDDDEIRLQKSLLVLCAFPFMITGVGWGIMYLAFGEVRAGIIPISYSVFSLFSIMLFAFTRKFQLFRFSQLLLILLLPAALMFALGGFVQGSAVILWALISPLGAMLFDSPKKAPQWFAAFLALVVLSGLMQPFQNYQNHLSAKLITFFFVINFVGVSSLIFFMVYYFFRQKNVFQERSEQLLLNILPKEIVNILKHERRTIADHFDSASILFADVVNFTPMSSSMTPTELVELLNDVFSEFDTMVDKYDLEKIKTIGDCYMVASGVPRKRADHATALVNMAVEMRDLVSQHDFRGRRLAFRIGINSGPVVAGVIGRKKFIYDLWGDAVNTASRMESQGSAGMIQITRNTYELVKDHFECDPQGKVNVKGKGEMEVWFVKGKKNSPAM
ncbi:MAG: adenylate/guanylate cyclase domain-containing protein [Bacteroidetes bacterium]|nr:adenylate/guanylate cyclase domain-containing protein [Bacteroidota bacterium]